METDAELRFDRGDATPERFKRQIQRLMGMTGAQMGKVSGAALGAIGARRDHFLVLAALAEFGPASQSQLADRTRVYRSDLVAVLNELEETGLIRRAPDPADKRRNVITLTDAGGGRLAELDEVLEGVNERIMAPLSQAERRELFRLLGLINAHLAGDA
ncbi:MarR family winged helix-turn-helix transcriptional regulator [Glycomyces tritici]|uniref:MarR family transcriptional regulator n=1 Tax=Glycomyces tritici TaxID=2665176 RepID=A0ABT7YPX7_9ACTN|nr:MarR family transcriptional regulator [Glycomyces tritici]MDN3240702.1 MarR family transcriptional regulator [Glycomyces tritici]